MRKRTPSPEGYYHPMLQRGEASPSWEDKMYQKEPWQENTYQKASRSEIYPQQQEQWVDGDLTPRDQWGAVNISPSAFDMKKANRGTSRRGGARARSMPILHGPDPRPLDVNESQHEDQPHQDVDESVRTEWWQGPPQEEQACINLNQQGTRGTNQGMLEQHQQAMPHPIILSLQAMAPPVEMRPQPAPKARLSIASLVAPPPQPLHPRGTSRAVLSIASLVGPTAPGPRVAWAGRLRRVQSASFRMKRNKLARR